MGWSIRRRADAKARSVARSVLDAAYRTRIHGRMHIFADIEDFYW